MIDRSQCEALDVADPLAAYRDRFRIPDGLIYLDGNSLGALPAQVPDRVSRVVEVEWGRDLITAWNRHGWVDLPSRVGDRIGKLIGAPPRSVIVCDSTSVNLHKAVSAALEMTDRRVVLSDSGNFPTDLYVASNVADLRIVEPEDLVDSITGDVGVVALTHVGYADGRMHDMGEVTEAAHAAGALMVWDLSHTAGAMPVELGATDFAVGCGYKYLNGGPGAPAYLYVRPDRIAGFRNAITGWFGHETPFDFALDFVPDEGITRALVGTPHVLSLVALDAALDVFDDVDFSLVRRKSETLGALFVDLVEARTEGIALVSPREPSRRGSQVCLSHPEGYAIVQALIEESVIGDFRAPDVLRFGFAPLYVRHVDVYDAVTRLVRVLETGAHLDARYRERKAVT